MREIDKLLKKLEEWYPDKVLRRELTPFQQGQEVGRLEVIDAIKDLYRKKKDDS